MQKTVMAFPEKSLYEINWMKYYNFTKNNHWCIGGVKECNCFEEGTYRISWGKIPEDNKRQSIKQLSFMPTKSQINKKPVLPGYVKQLTNLELLDIPAPFLLNLSIDNLPSKLHTLRISFESKYNEAIDIKKLRWPSNLFLPNLKSIIFLAKLENDLIWPKLNILEEHLVNLEFLYSIVDKRGVAIDELNKFKKLKHLSLGSVRNFDLFDKISSNLKVFSVNSTGLKFPVIKLKRLKELEIIRLVNVKSEIDCELFLNFPNLIELEINSSKKIKSIEALLSCKQLKSIVIVDCGNPIKKEGKRKFKENAFKRLDIDYS